jgi:hypothetical protein
MAGPHNRAYEAQKRSLRRMARAFRANGHDFKWLMRAVTRSPWYRAVGYTGEADENRRAELDSFGLEFLLTPRQLSRKIRAVMGVAWRPDTDKADYLDDAGQYRLLYGGIDSDDVTKRLRAPNGVMANVQVRMAAEAPCAAVALDFARPQEERMLFPFVELSYQPEDANGFAIAQAEATIKENIKHLHAHVLGEQLEDDDPELEATWMLFLETWRARTEVFESDEEQESLLSRCRATVWFWSGEAIDEEHQVTTDSNYILRSWQTVLSYLLLDEGFVRQ